MSVCLLVLVAFAAATPWAGAGSVVHLLRDDVVYPVAVLGAALLTWVAARRAPAERRRFWVLSAASTSLWAAAQAYWAVVEVLHLPLPEPSAADVLLLASYLVSIVAVGLGFTASGSVLQWRGQIDAAVTSVAAAAAGWHWLVQPQLSGHLSVQTAIYAAYPVLDIGFFAVFVSVGLAGHRRIAPPVLAVVSAGAFVAVSDVLLAVLANAGRGLPDEVVTVIYVPGLLVGGVGALADLRHRGGSGSVSRPIEYDLGQVPVLLSVATVLAWAGADVAARGAVGPLPYGLTVVLVAGLVARSQLGNHDLRRVARRLDHALGEQRRLAVTDGLTGLYNRRMGEEVLALEIGRAGGRSAIYDVGVLILDLDHFKKINDVYGHGVGDLVLREAASRLGGVLRGSDVLVRWGGEEFLVVLPQLPPAEVLALAERLRLAVEQRPVRLEDGRRVSVSASIGVACAPGHARDVEALLRLADAALYAAKRDGRNRVRLADGLDDRPSGRGNVVRLHA